MKKENNKIKTKSNKKSEIIFLTSFLPVLFLLLVIPFLFVGQAQAQTTPICEAENGAHCYYIAPDGDDSNAGTFEAPFASTNPIINSL